ncbi:MAG: hypothetical protein EOM87_01205 [Clostridia bacterium]|nr:hypothetical protein [Clostridia bacterium]
MTLAGTNVQPLIFLAVVGAGLISALLYSGCFVIRYLTGFKRVVEMITDIFFVVISAGMYFMALYYSGFGEMRVYTVLGFLLGFFTLYFLLRPLKKIMPKIKVKLEKMRKLPILNKIFK